MISRRLSAAFRTAWWALVLAAVLGGALGFGFTQLQTPEYSSSAELFVSTTGGTSSTESYQGNQFSQQRTASYAYMLTSEVLAQRVIDQLGLQMSADRFVSKVTATVVPRTVLLDVGVTDPDPQRAADMANALAAKFIEFVGPLETPVGQEEPRATITIVSAAEPAAAPSSPVVSRAVSLGVLAGLAVGLGIVGYLAFLSRRIRSSDDVERYADVPGLGRVRVEQRDAEARAAQLMNWTTEDANDFRRLRGQLEAGDPPPSVIVVSSGSQSDPSVEFATDLAVSFAESGKRTLLIGLCSDFSSRASGFDLSKTAGFSDLVHGRAELDEAASPSSSSNLFLVTAGDRDIDTILSAPTASEVFEHVRNQFDRIVVAVASVQESSAAVVLAAIADTEILVVRNRAPARYLQRAARELRTVRANVFGAVLVVN